MFLNKVMCRAKAHQAMKHSGGFWASHLLFKKQILELLWTVLWENQHNAQWLWRKSFRRRTLTESKTENTLMSLCKPWCTKYPLLAIPHLKTNTKTTDRIRNADSKPRTASYEEKLNGLIFSWIFSRQKNISLSIRGYHTGLYSHKWVIGLIISYVWEIVGIEQN